MLGSVVLVEWHVTIRRYQSLGFALVAGLGMLAACATSKSEMAWVRIDGRRIGDDPALLRQGQADIALCHANLDVAPVSDGTRECMNKQGYALVTREQAEEARARFAATAAQSGTMPPPTGR